MVVTVLDGNNNAGDESAVVGGVRGLASTTTWLPTCRTPCRLREPYDCTTCHLSKNKDNNTWLAQVLDQGTNGYNFVGDYEWIGVPGSIRAVRVSYGYEPQPVIGSNMQRIMDPDKFNEFLKAGRRLDKSSGYSTPEDYAGKDYSPRPKCLVRGNTSERHRQG